MGRKDWEWEGVFGFDAFSGDGRGAGDGEGRR